MAIANSKILCISTSHDCYERWRESLARKGVDIFHISELSLSLRQIEHDDYAFVIVEASGIVADDIDLVRRLRLYYEVPLLLRAVNYTEESCVAAYSAGVDECIAGPIGEDLLGAKIDAWLHWSEKVSNTRDTVSNPRVRTTWN